ncbi:hypothetical protein [Verminephrobacter eiseniae]|uniref:Uncharacterized protein n=1 Tax=Verminephrobacter eiseniae (strain EF01-2) TaxID=391735 RepID=A1WQH6_VEREI|nr:hypothetical protein [Verminephrobacter eiseniae]ABM59883.1 conserved hypothetical protein [Verminephrobacter eiseniae EF01-2]MCW5285394.1 hypothetical protein [Verminephrobacter eiseniae]MCW5303695.1 hypothetical protein [Verminephrobacter eiseniae]MCW8179330.1 hypothetical protein [Verminephrobacter eiseniae]MCW8189994.1 hypothetical protein [Verminephrobacter eiseniae]
MKQRYTKFNPKRRLKACDAPELARLAQLAQRVNYGGNPEHKKNPGDFGLTPPADPRPGKSLCESIGVFTRAEALDLLKHGLTKGLVSDRSVGDWPKNIWSVTAQGWPLEAQLENAENGVYHGYPMPDSDPFASEVAERWADGGAHA